MPGQVKEQAAARGQQLSEVADAMPDTVSDRAHAVATWARRHRAQLAIAAALGLLAAAATRRRW
ncbi:MAG TPA: hypothetical protein VNW50_04730 [Streptosporangiaceae bacterium]|nr:hypothetical protein [Streptosporangiaceae bacterium]